ncbi:hypothetical protein LCGC14_1401380, partial [marine sediment metagenome]
ELKNVSFGLDSKPFDEARLIKAEINGITIINSYIPQGDTIESEKFAYKLNWFKQLNLF